jgi:hypothetical protein
LSGAPIMGSRASSLSDGLPVTAAGRGVTGVKTKCANWKRENAERHRLFEPPKPKTRERERVLAKQREELARVLERLEGTEPRIPGHGPRVTKARRDPESRDRRIAGLGTLRHASCCFIPALALG